MGKTVGELARKLLSFKRPTRAHRTARQYWLFTVTWGTVAPNASSPRILSRMSWFFTQCSAIKSLHR